MQKLKRQFTSKENMPQEKGKPRSYRSFLICDDPRGIVACQAIRKSSVISPQKRDQQPINNKIEGERKQQCRNKSLAVLLEEEKKQLVGVTDEERGVTRELVLPTTPSFHLNNVINSSSNGEKGNRKSTSKDVFRSAFGLQESLTLLNRLKEGQKAWISSRKSLDEMKKVVRDSLLRQCVISNPVFEHHFDDGKDLNSPDLLPSPSSSQSSSMVYSSNFAPSDFLSSSSSSSLGGKMAKGSSLIVKLMGLESFPFSPGSNRQCEKIMKLSKPMYDIVSPNARKLGFRAKDLSLNQSSMDEEPPIVVMKTLSSSSDDLKKRVIPNSKEKFVKKFDSSKAKVSGSISMKTQKKQEVVEEKVSEVVKVNSNGRKREEKKVAKSSNQLSSSKIRRQKDSTPIAKIQNPGTQKTDSSVMLDQQRSKSPKSFSQQERNRRPVLNGDKKKSKGSSKETEAALEEKINAIGQNDSKASDVQIRGYGIEEHICLSGPEEDASMAANEDDNANNPDDSQTASHCDTTLASISRHNNPEQLDENGVTDHRKKIKEPSPSAIETDSETSRKFLAERSKLKASILSSPSFASRAEELFDLQLNPNSIPPVNGEEDHHQIISEDTKLLLDCAEEVLEFRSDQLSQACQPLPRSYKPHPRNALSFDQLLEEISNGIEDLKGYLSSTTDHLFSDTLHWIIDRDLRFKSRAWEIGWRNTFSQVEVEQVIGEVDKLVLGNLIEEIVVDFL